MVKAFYSRAAYELQEWARQEPDRLKASRIYLVALSLEQRYRANHKREVNDPYIRPAVDPGRPPSNGSSVSKG
jgi:hypothetical protein